jgi:acyl-CoA synthetase (AMP-forming)/AMP-acid ligase II
MSHAAERDLPFMGPGFRLTVLKGADGTDFGRDDIERIAARVARKLRSDNLANTPVGLVFEPGAAFFGAFIGCLQAGALPFALRPPRGHAVAVFQAIIDGASPGLVLTDAVWHEATSHAVGGRIACVAIDALDAALFGDVALRDPDAPLFLQYSSGSTTRPKGVLVSSRNLHANYAMLAATFPVAASAVHLSWLPHYHDMGLILAYLRTAHIGGHLIVMNPRRILQAPLSWLQAISDFRATISGGPNFAFDVCARAAQRAGTGDLGIDLSSWEVAVNGADTIRGETLRAFEAAFAPYGLRPTALSPGYGLAEATLIVTAKPYGRRWSTTVVDERALQDGRATAPGDGAAVVEIVNCGPSPGEQDLRIVNPETLRPAPSDRVGEIWVRGPHASRGYRDRPDLSAETMNARLDDPDGPSDGWLRTGDLGFLRDGDLHIVGRIKDVIVVNGRNIPPSEIEAVAGPPSGLRGSVAVTSFGPEGDVQIDVVVEARGDLEAIGEGIWERTDRLLRDRFGTHLGTLTLVRPGCLPRTTSGKLRRSQCRHDLAHGRFDILWQKRADPPRVVPAPPPAASQADYAAWLRILAVPLVGRDDIALDVPLSDQGMDSLALLRFFLTIEAATGRTDWDAVLLDDLTLDRIAGILAGEMPVAPPADTAPLASRQHGKIRGLPGRALRRILPYPAYLRLHLLRHFRGDAESEAHMRNARSLAREAALIGDPDANARRALFKLRAVEALLRWAVPRGRVDRYVDLKNPEYLLDAQRDARPVVLVALHGLAMNVMPHVHPIRTDPFAIIGNATVQQKRIAEVAGSRIHDLNAARRVLAEGGRALIMIDGSEGTGGITFSLAGRRRVLRFGFAELALASGALIVPVASRVSETGRMQFAFSAPIDLAGNADRVAPVARLVAAWMVGSWSDHVLSLSPSGQRMHLSAPTDPDA